MICMSSPLRLSLPTADVPSVSPAVSGKCLFPSSRLDIQGVVLGFGTILPNQEID